MSFSSLLKFATVFANVLMIIATFPAIAAQENERPIENKWALVVGISEFQDSSKLKYGAKDAQDFYDYLTTKGNFAADHVRLLTNAQATKGNIMGALGDKWLLRVARPDDLLVVYLSTVGTPAKLDVKGIHYLVPYDGSMKSLFSSGIEMQSLGDMIKSRCDCRNVLLIVNASYSGVTEFGGGGLIRVAPGKQPPATGTQAVICACAANQTAWDCKNSANSVFTRRLIEALQVKETGTTIGEAFQYLKTRVQADVQAERGAQQIPVLHGTGLGLTLSLPAKLPTEQGN